MRNPFGRSRAQRDADLDEEVLTHLAMAAADRVARGETVGDAERAARREFGNVTLVQEITREMWGGAWLARIMQDIPYAARALAKAPIFTVAVSLLLAIGIGVNGAVVSIIDTSFLRKLPVPDPDRIVVVRSGDARVPIRRDASRMSSFPDGRDVAVSLRDVGEFGAYFMESVKLGDDLAGSVAWSAFVTGNYFSLLGVAPARGRMIAPDEERPAGKHPVVVISDNLWHTRFASDEHVVGRQLTIQQTRFTIIGVMPPGFTGTHPEGRTDIWLPYTMQAEATGRSSFDEREARVATIVGRLAPSATIPSVQGRLDGVARDLAARFPQADAHLRFHAVSHSHLVSSDEFMNAMPTFLLVWAMVAILHLVACSNVAGLMLARGAARRRELGIRLCLGASRTRVVWLMLTEPILLGVLGATGGIILARWLTSLLCGMQFLSAMDAGLDVRLVTIIAVLSAATAIQFGLLPARQAARNDPLELIRGASATHLSGQRGAAQALIVVQVALSLVLLADATAMLRSFDRQAHANPGYDTGRVVVARLELKTPGVAAEDALARVQRLTANATALREEAIARLAVLANVERVATAQGAPLYSGSFEDVKVQGHEYARDESMKMSTLNVGPGYFATIGAPILRGREFSTADPSDPTRGHGTFDAVIVNESMARRYWPNVDPLGKTVSFRGRGSATVIGVVRDMHDVSLARCETTGVLPGTRVVLTTI